MSINSHKQIPQFLLENFSHIEEEHHEQHINRVNYVYFIDIKHRLIDSVKVKDFGAAINYYNDNTEIFLSTMVEGPFSKVVKTICKYKKFSVEMLGKEAFEATKRFATYSIIRSKNILSKVSHSSIKKVMGIVSNDDIVRSCLDIDLFSNSEIILVTNKTSKEFAISHNCVTSIKFKNKQYFFLPISTTKGFLLKKKDNDSDLYIFKEEDIDDEYTVNQFNLAAFDIEKNNEGVVVAFDENYLIELATAKGIKPKKKGVA